MNTLLQDPTAAEVETSLRNAIDSANQGARARLVGWHHVEGWVEAVASEPEGLLAADGGAVCNSYKYQAETTSALVAWWTDGRGRKTVRVSATRAVARHTSGGGGSGASTPRGSAWSNTFPDRAGRLSKARQDRLKRLLARVGPEGSDDRLSIWAPRLAAVSAEGLLVADHHPRPKVVQVVVRDSTTRQRHHITVPPKFADPASKTYQRLGSSAARVHAAIAWTFSLSPEQYAPTVEA